VLLSTLNLVVEPPLSVNANKGYPALALDGSLINTPYGVPEVVFSNCAI